MGNACSSSPTATTKTARKTPRQDLSSFHNAVCVDEREHDVLCPTAVPTTNVTSFNQEQGNMLVLTTIGMSPPNSSLLSPIALMSPLLHHRDDATSSPPSPQDESPHSQSRPQVVEEGEEDTTLLSASPKSQHLMATVPNPGGIHRALPSPIIFGEGSVPSGLRSIYSLAKETTTTPATSLLQLSERSGDSAASFTFCSAAELSSFRGKELGCLFSSSCADQHH